MKSAPLVSVLMPAYQAAHLVADAIESALGQTVDDLEVVFVDDGSDDETAQIADAYARRDPRVRVLRNGQNRGTNRSVNRAVAEARGDWVAQHDVDDSWHPERLERLLAAAAEADVVSDDVEIVVRADGSGRITGFRPGPMLPQLGVHLTKPAEWTLVGFARVDPGLVHPLIRREFLVRHELGRNPEVAIGGDFGLWMRLLAHGARWVQLPEAYYRWSPTATSLTSDLETMAAEAAHMTELLLADPLVAAMPGAPRALAGRARLFRSHVAHARVRPLVDARQFGALAGLLVREPALAPLLLWRKAHYMRVRARRTREPSRTRRGRA